MAYLLGFVIGVLAGMFGVGGSSISTPALKIFLGVPPLIALATPLPITIPIAITGGITYYRHGLVNLKVFFLCALAGTPGVVLGAMATRFVSGHGLMLLTSFFILLVGIRFLATAIPVRRREAIASRTSHQSEWWETTLIGFGVGFLSGLLANGGGFLLVPAFVFLLRFRVKEAMPTSLAVVAAFALPGTIMHWWLGHIDARLMLQLGLGVIPATYLGAHLSLRLKGRQLRALFGIFLVLFAGYFGYLQIAGLSR